MCKKCEHSNVIILKTPGSDHEIFWCEDCDFIVGTSHDFATLEEPQNSEKIYWIKKPVESILTNIS